MSQETGVRTIIARPDGGVSVLAATPPVGKESIGARLTRAERKAGGGTVVGRVDVDKVRSDRRLRNAWRIDALTGRVVIDLEAARALKAEQWAAEGAELQQFISGKLMLHARILGQRDTVDRLNGALKQIEAVVDDLAGRIGAMTEGELASHKPDWPQLNEGR